MIPGPRIIGKPVIGLIGSIGAGKSTAAKFFGEFGGRVIDADAIGHQALEQEAVKSALVQRWGNGILKPNGQANRRAIAAIVFDRPEERKFLETNIFPEISRRVQEQIAAAQHDPSVTYIVLDAAVLLEAGWGTMVDRIVYVDAPRPLRLSRVAARSGWSDVDLAEREVAQWPIERKKAMAESILVNDGSTDQLRAAVRQLLASWGWVNGND